MNNKNKIVLFLASSLILLPLTAQEVGTLAQEKKIGNLTYKKKLHYVCDQASYVNGGVTFNYPDKTFSSTPMVNVSIKLHSPLDADATWSAVVVASDASSVTIGVTQNSSMGHREATTDEVDVTIYAIGKP